MTAASVRAYRLESIDLLRGLVIALMAIDHCRDFLLASGTQDPMADPNIPPALFATRWITHFCAPVFVFLAGTSAGLMSARKTPAELGRFLLQRGLWLIAIECTVISLAWTFSPLGVAQDSGHVWVILQVIWALGASMVVLAGLQFFGLRGCLVLGALIVLGHNLLDTVWPAAGRNTLQPIWVGLHTQMSLVAGDFRFICAYPLLPWTGVMLLGFGSATVFRWEAARRRRFLFRAGLAMSLAFIVLRAINAYGDPHPWVAGDGLARTAMNFLNTNKYPPSLDYVLMTLGPAAIFCAWAETLRGRVSAALVTLGRVPFAFYVAHLYLIHLLAMLLGMLQGYDAGRFITPFFFFPKDGYGVPLAGVYAGWVMVLAILYPFCRWVAQVKARRKDGWLSYV